MSTDNPILILVRGIPGSGKSYLADNLQKTLAGRTTASKVVTIDPDATDHTSQAYITLTKELTDQGVDPKFHPYRFIRAKAHAGIDARAIVIWNQPFTNLDGFEKTIKNLQAYAAEHGMQLPLLVVEVEIDPVVAKQRVADRKKQGGHGPSEATFSRFTNDYVSFANKGYPTVVVQGEVDTAASVSTIITALEELPKL